MKFSSVLFNSKISIPQEGVTRGLGYLLKGSFIEPVGSGLYSFVHLGFRALKNVENIIREEMEKIGAQEVLMNALHPKKMWEESGRYETYNPPLFKLKDIHDKDFVLAPTHEELITTIVKKRAFSYKNLPIAVFQIQNKFRNELRAKTGILRVREFLMKDLYSFHASEADLSAFYEVVAGAYDAIFKRCGIKAHKVRAIAGSIGGSVNHEYAVEADVGEDTILLCSQCSFGANQEYLVGKKNPVCFECGGALNTKKAIELGHIFKLGTLYSEKLSGTFIDEKGERKPYIMGCYGIGVGRLLGAIAEVCSDDKGFMFNAAVAPYQVYVTALSEESKASAQKVYTELQAQGFSVLFDDRDSSAGEKFYDADLIGIPYRLVISKKTGDKIELKLRSEEKPRGVFDIKEILSIISEKMI